MDTLRIFISSPGDVAEERERARHAVRVFVVAALAAFAGTARVSGTEGPQGAAPGVPRAAAAGPGAWLQQALDLRQEAIALVTAGNTAAAVAKTDEALALVRGDSPLERRFRAALFDTRALVGLGAAAHDAVAADALAAAAIWRALGPEQAESLAGSLLQAGFALIQTKRHAEAVTALVEARDVLAAEPDRRDRRLLHALSLLATAAGATGDDHLTTASLADYVRLAADLGLRDDAAFAIHWRLLGARLLADTPPDPQQLDLWVRETDARTLPADDAVMTGEMVARLTAAGDYARSLRLASVLADWRRDQRPRDALALAAALEGLGKVHAASGDFPAAIRVLREAAGLLAAGHPREHAFVLTHLAGLVASTGDYIQAQADFTAALGTLATLEGPDAIRHAQALGGLGMLNLQLGDTARATTRLAEAVRRAEAVGEPAGAVAGNLRVQLAIAEGASGDIAAARRNFARGRDLIATAFGRDHPILLVIDQAGAGIEMEAEGDPEAAASMMTGIVDRVRRLPGGGGLILAQALDGLADVAVRRGDRDRALPLLVEAKAIRETTGDDRSLGLVRSLLRIAEVRGLDDAASRADVERALDLCDDLLGPVFASLSERQQLAAGTVAHRAIGVALSMPTAADPGATAALHDRMLRWKGAIFARQHWVRRALADPRTAALTAELRAVSATIAAAALRPAEEPRDERLVELTDRRDALERSLAAAAGRESGPAVTSAALAAALPADTALVDFLEFTPGGVDGERAAKRLVAFVVRRGDDAVRIDLGAAAAVREALGTWRPWQAATPTDAAAAAAALRRLVWTPLEPHLAGAAVVLVSPDGCLGELPFAALPGRNTGEMLLDEVPISYVPVPSLVPQLLARPHAAAEGGAMLLVGDVDFGSPPDGAAPGSTVLPAEFPPLPGTATEVEAIAELAATLEPSLATRRLAGGAATVDAVRTALADARFVHLATHGFFADAPQAVGAGTTRGIAGAASLVPADVPPTPAVGDVIGGFHPGALSGIVLAGFNGGLGSASGVLTALEVADLDLGSAELVVLSACDTRRGRQAAGEGLLGLQRAFEVAGARSIVATLWQVDDDATATLMREFYRNLWQRRLPRAEALRQAQRHVAREYTPPVESTAPRGVAGSADLPVGRPLPPAFWAAFVLSGDWR